MNNEYRSGLPDQSLARSFGDKWSLLILRDMVPHRNGTSASSCAVEVYPGHYAGSTFGRGIGRKDDLDDRERAADQPLSKVRPEQFVEHPLANTPPFPADFWR